MIWTYFSVILTDACLTQPSSLGYQPLQASLNSNDTVQGSEPTVEKCCSRWWVLLISLLLCLLKDTDWCYSTSEPFTYSFPWPNRTSRTGSHRRPYMPVFNWLLIDSALATGDNKLPPAWEGSDGQVQSGGVRVLFSLSNIGLHYLYTPHFYLCSKNLWCNTWWNNGNTVSLVETVICIGQCTSIHGGCRTNI